MPIYEYQCQNCGKVAEQLIICDVDAPMCCGKVMERKPAVFNYAIKQIGKVTAHCNGEEIYSS